MSQAVDPKVRFDGVGPVAPQLFRLLREQIVCGELVPDTRLSEAEIALAYGISRQPVREAFIKLAEAGLIDIRPQRGSFVSRIALASVRSVQFVREAVEADIARQAALAITLGDLAGLEALLAEQAAAAALLDARPFMRADEAFHRRLAAVVGQSGGWDLLQPMKSQMDRVRHLSARQFPRQGLVAQHRRIVEALRARDADAAEAAMRHHLRQILQDLPVVAEAQPELFAPKGR